MLDDQKENKLEVSCNESGQPFCESSAGDAGLRNINRIMSGAKINTAGESGRFAGINYQGPQEIQKGK